MPSILSLLATLLALFAVVQVLALPNNASIATYSIPRGRYEQSYCGWFGAKGSWEIYTKGWGRHDDTSEGGCGSDLLEELRRCPVDIAAWGCVQPARAAKDDEHGALAYFRVTRPFNGRRLHCIENAVEGASGYRKDRVQCRNLEHDE